MEAKAEVSIPKVISLVGVGLSLTRNTGLVRPVHELDRWEGTAKNGEAFTLIFEKRTQGKLLIFFSTPERHQVATFPTELFGSFTDREVLHMCENFLSQV